MEVMAVIPARGGSKGLPRKNLRKLAGVPLVEHAIRQAIAAPSVQRVVVSTDDAEIAELARSCGAEVPFLRPPEFATDDATDLDVFRHLLTFLAETEGRVPDLLVQVRATSPVRRPEIIDLAVAKLAAAPEADSLRTLSVAPFTPYKMWTVSGASRLTPVMRLAGRADWYDLPRQELPDVFVQDGLVDVVRSATILRKNSMAGDVVLGLLHADPAVDIDDAASLSRAEDVLTRMTEAAGRPMGTLGIVQGRLTPSWNGELQCFPAGSWRDEFALAAAVGLEHIELLVDRQPNEHNPLWSAEGRSAMKDVIASTGVTVWSASIDRIMDSGIAATQVRDWLCTIAPALAEVGVGAAVLPLFDASAITWPLMPVVGKNLRRVADVFGRCGIRVCLESELPGAELYELVGFLEHDNIGICYDIGNATALDHDTASDISLLGPAVWHVHVKDKDAAGVNVPLGQGRADLAACIAALARSGFRGSLSLETPRGADPVAMAARHRSVIADLLAIHAR